MARSNRPILADLNKDDERGDRFAELLLGLASGRFEWSKVREYFEEGGYFSSLDSKHGRARFFRAVRIRDKKLSR